MVLAHLGRGEHNDVVIAEESVSDSHAKLQRRDGTWYVIDLGSTNGTYVGGKRIEGEERLGSTADLRLGGVKLAFAATATEPVTEPRGSTRQFSGVSAADFAPRPAPSRSGAAAPRPSRPAAREPASPRMTTGGGSGGLRWLWLLIGGAAVIGATLYIIKGR
jgi:ABC transport system ATP-binding/permease protein